MATDTIIREACADDLARVVAIWAEHLDYHALYEPRCVRSPDSEEGFCAHLREQLGGPDGHLLVAELGGEIVGFLFPERKQYPPCFVERDHGLISDLAVTAEWRRQGIGKALLARGMAWFASQGLDTVEARVLLANPISTKFWHRMGFAPYLQTVRRIEPAPG